MAEILALFISDFALIYLQRHKIELKTMYNTVGIDNYIV